MFGVVLVSAFFLLISNSYQHTLTNVNKTIITEHHEASKIIEVLENIVLRDINGTNPFHMPSQEINENVSKVLQQSLDKTVIPDDFALNITQFLTKYGYPSQTYSVTTDDGYILSLQRIIHGRNAFLEEKVKRKSIVLLMHGLLGSSIDWVYLGPKKSLGLILADAGYDVWLGNNRGTTLSRKHEKLNPDTSKEFWDFSFDELGYYDVPAFIDFILNVTGEEKLRYIGFSQGTSQFYAMGARRPEYLKKIEHATSFAPVVYTNHMSSPFSTFFLQHMDTVKKLVDRYNINEVLPHTEFMQNLARNVCAQGSPFQDACITIIFTIVGFDYNQLNRTFLPILLSNSPSGSSVKSFMHYLQLHEINSFKRYDYGSEKNMKAYKSPTPPILDISGINIPIALIYAPNDFLSATADVEKLKGELPNVHKSKLISQKTFNHLDFMIAKEVDKLVYNDFIRYYDRFVATNGWTSAFGNSYSRNVLLLLIFSITFFV